MKVYLHCLYCGKRWDETFWNEALIRNVRCPDCKETKLIKAEKAEDDTTDVFGYRFSPPFPAPIRKYSDADSYSYRFD